MVVGYVPMRGEDQRFPKGFVIKAEKCPNRRGVEEIVGHFGGKSATWRDFLGQAGEGRFKAACVVGGYPDEWVTPEVAGALAKIEFLVCARFVPVGVGRVGGDSDPECDVGRA